MSSRAVSGIGIFRRQSIALRLTLAFAAIIFALGLVSTACIWALIDTHQRLHAVKLDEEKARTVIRLASAVRDQYAHVARTIIRADASHVPHFHAASRNLGQLAASVGKQTGSSLAQHRVDRILTTSREIQLLFASEVLPLVRAGDRAALNAQHERILALATAAQNDAEALVTAVEASLEDLSQHVSAVQHGAILLTMASQVLALVTAVLVGVYLYRSIARPVATLSAATAHIAGGDLDTEIAVVGHDELAELSRRLNGMTRALKEDQERLLVTEKIAGLGRVAAGIAHELNNPLGVILGYAKLLRRGGAPGDPKILAAIEEEAERCHQVIEDLLVLTRGGVLRTEPIDLRRLTEDVLDRLRLARPASSTPVAVQGHAVVQGDPGKLGQVLTNLVANAIDACGSDGQVTVAIATEGSGSAKVVVSDSGPGVPLSISEHLFEPFFTTKQSGTGLGLAISRAIARAHGGDLTLDMRATPGASFELTLPWAGEVA